MFLLLLNGTFCLWPSVQNSHPTRCFCRWRTFRLFTCYFSFAPLPEIGPPMGHFFRLGAAETRAALESLWGNDLVLAIAGRIEEHCRVEIEGREKEQPSHAQTQSGEVPFWDKGQAGTNGNNVEDRGAARGGRLQWGGIKSRVIMGPWMSRKCEGFEILV